MMELIVFYLLATGTQLLPTFFITVCLLYGTPTPVFSKMLRGLPPLNRALRKIGIARMQQFFQVFDPDTMKYIKSYYIMVCSLQFVTIVLTILAIIFELPLPYVEELKNIPRGILFEIMKFSIIATVLQLIPFLLFVLGLAYELPLPFMPSPPVHHAPPIADIVRGAQLSRNFATIHLTRAEHLENTFIYANCRDERFGGYFKLVLCQGKNEEARTECYMYHNIYPTLEKINFPVSVRALEEIMNLRNE